mgnify:CR=1 FL=1
MTRWGAAVPMYHVGYMVQGGRESGFLDKPGMTARFAGMKEVKISACAEQNSADPTKINKSLKLRNTPQ